MAEIKSLEEKKQDLVNEIIELRMERCEAFNNNHFEDVVRINRKINKLRDKVEYINSKMRRKTYLQY